MVEDRERVTIIPLKGKELSLFNALGKVSMDSGTPGKLNIGTSYLTVREILDKLAMSIRNVR